MRSMHEDESALINSESDPRTLTKKPRQTAAKPNKNTAELT